MSNRYKCLFSYYGGKSKIAHMYPAPKHDTIVEPFAGGAAYSLRHHERQVIINDLDKTTWNIWDFLLSPSALDLIEQLVPDDAPKGARVSEMLPSDVHLGFTALLRGQASAGTEGSNGTSPRVTQLGSNGWPRIKPRLRYWLPLIQHWELLGIDYKEVPNRVATWFIDPPYNNHAGQRYRTRAVDFNALAQWSRERHGQVIVCENAGADWLPFEPLIEQSGMRKKAMEVIYEQ